MNALETIHNLLLIAKRVRAQGCFINLLRHKKIVNSLVNFAADPVKSGFVITLQKHSNYETVRKAARTGA